MSCGNYFSQFTQLNRNELEWFDWCLRNPNHDSSKLILNKPAMVGTWKEYATHMTTEEGAISYHFVRLVIFENEKISCDTKCIHNSFMGVQDCIRNLFLALRGAIMIFKQFFPG
eukprot:430510_1